MSATAKRMSRRSCLVRGRAQSSGFSLIELVISMVVIGIALAALSSQLFRGAGHSADSLWQAKASLLAQAYLDEILAMRYQENSPYRRRGGGPLCDIRPRCGRIK